MAEALEFNMDDSAPTERLAWTIKEFCAASRLGQTKVYELARQGKLRITKVGRRSIITDDDGRRLFATLQAEPRGAA